MGNRKYLEKLNKENTREIFESFKKLPPKQLELIYKTSDWAYINRSEFKAIYDLLRPYFNKGLKLLDVGCGDGRFLIPLEGKFRLYGLDFSKSFLKEVKKHCNSCRTIFGYAEKLPFKSNSFDIVISVRLIQHSSKKQQQAQINEMYRVVKHGGKVIVLNYNSISILNIYKKICQSKVPKFWPFIKWRWVIDEYNSPSELHTMFKKAGFTSIETTGCIFGEPDVLRLTKTSVFLNKISSSILVNYYRLCESLENYAKRSVLTNLMNRVIVIGGK